MPSSHTKFRDRHQDPFLKALAYYGKVKPAARAAHISRDAVYDWLHTDPEFKELAAQAVLVAQEIARPDYRENAWFFFSTVQDFIPAKYHPAVIAEINVAIAQLEFKKAGSSTASLLSRTKARFPFSISPRGQATSGENGSRDLIGKNGTGTLT